MNAMKSVHIIISVPFYVHIDSSLVYGRELVAEQSNLQHLQ